MIIQHKYNTQIHKHKLAMTKNITISHIDPTYISGQKRQIHTINELLKKTHMQLNKNPFKLIQIDEAPIFDSNII